MGGGGFDQVGASDEDAGALRAADALAAAVDHQIGAVAQVAVQVIAGRQHRGGVYDDRNAAGVSDFADAGQGQDFVAGKGGAQVGHGGGAVVNRALQLPGMGEKVIAEFHHLGAGRPVRLVVGKAVHGVNDDFVFHCLGFGELPHFYRVVAGDAGGCLEQQSARGAAAYEPGLGAGKSGDFLPGGAVQFVNVHHYAGGLRHQGQGFRPGAGAAQPGDGAGGVDDGIDAKPPVGGFGVRGAGVLGHGILLSAGGLRAAGRWVGRYYTSINIGRGRARQNFVLPFIGRGGAVKFRSPIHPSTSSG